MFVESYRFTFFLIEDKLILLVCQNKHQKVVAKLVNWITPDVKFLCRKFYVCNIPSLPFADLEVRESLVYWQLREKTRMKKLLNYYLIHLRKSNTFFEQSCFIASATGLAQTSLGILLQLL